MRAAGMRHVSFKPGSSSAIRQVVAIARENPDRYKRSYNEHILASACICVHMHEHTHTYADHVTFKPAPSGRVVAIVQRYK